MDSIMLRKLITYKIYLICKLLMLLAIYFMLIYGCSEKSQDQETDFTPTPSISPTPTPRKMQPNQITNNEFDDEYPDIHEDMIVWQGFDGSLTQIYLWDGESGIVKITSHGYFDNYWPKIHNGQLTWFSMSGTSGDSCEVWFWDGSKCIRITTNQRWDSSPVLNNGQIAWLFADPADTIQIALWDGNSIRQISHNSWANTQPSIHNGQVVWAGIPLNSVVDVRDIFFWDGSTLFNVTDDNNRRFSSPRVCNGQIAFVGATIGECNEIYFWDSGSITQMTFNNNNDINPDLHNGQITWQGHDGNDFEIFVWDGTSTIQVTDNDFNDVNPRIHNGFVVWERSQIGHNEIYFWDGTQIFQITDNLKPDKNPRIYNGRITWQCHDGNDWEIMTWNYYDYKFE